MQTILSTLPHDHALRNTPLISINAFYRTDAEKIGREIFPNFGIAKKTYNQLGKVWTDNEIFYTNMEVE